MNEQNAQKKGGAPEGGFQPSPEFLKRVERIKKQPRFQSRTAFRLCQV